MFSTELLKHILFFEKDISDTGVIREYIQADLKNPVKAEMAQGVKYYSAEQDIPEKDARKYHVDGKKMNDFIANNHNINPFHRILVQQKIGYIVGNSIVVSSDDDKYTDSLNEALGMKLDDVLAEWIKGACNKGVEWLHIFIDEAGNLDYIIIPAEQIIPIYDPRYQKRLEYVIRYYVTYIVREDKVAERHKVELWDNEKVTYYMEDEDGDYYLDNMEPVNPRFHWYSFNTNNPTDLQANSWGRVPFIRLDNNSEQQSDLRPIKKYIDGYDTISSGLLNGLDDIQLAIWTLERYEGTDLSEFMRSLISSKAVKVLKDEVADNKTIEIPTEASNVILGILEDKIYEIGQGIKMSSDKFGNNPLGVVHKFLYWGLDLKADTMIRKLKKALQEFMWFCTEYINLVNKTRYDYRTVKITVNKSIITNEAYY